MSNKTLSQLKNERNVLDKQIRAARVQQLRALCVGKKVGRNLAHLMAEVDRRLMAVYYDVLEFDSLLDEIEDRIELRLS